MVPILCFWYLYVIMSYVIEFPLQINVKTIKILFILHLTTIHTVKLPLTLQQGN